MKKPVGEKFKKIIEGPNSTLENDLCNFNKKI